MAQADQRKMESWARHVERCSSSGLAVRKYCQRESLAVHDYYYWRRKLNDSAQSLSNSESRRQLPLANSHAAEKEQTIDDSSVAMVQIHFGNQASVNVPAHMLEAVRAVLEMALKLNSGNQSAPASGAFHPVVVRA